jgi:uncharacterized protein YecE (DUF72 family)
VRAATQLVIPFESVTARGTAARSIHSLGALAELHHKRQSKYRSAASTVNDTPNSSAVTAAPIRIGPAGWSYADWAGIVYPSRKPRGFHEATYLAEFFDTIEINTSFYHPMRAEHCRQWIERVAANPRFLFTAKLWQKFTHEHDAGDDDERAVRAGFDVLRDAGKLGAMLLQFPFSFHRTEETTEYLKKLLTRFEDYPLVVEVRHATWNDKSFYAMLHARGVGFCNIDQPVIGRSMKPTERATAQIAYVRLHGRRYDSWFSDDPAVPPSERYNYLYTTEELEPWAKRIRHLSEEGHTTFVVTNNHFEGKGIVNALQLIRMLTGKNLKLPEPLRQHYPELESIASEPPAAPTLFRT